MAFRPPWYAWIALAICAAAFLVRGPIRAVRSDSNIDAPLLLSAAATWQRGGDPYDPASIRSNFGNDAALISATLSRGAQAFVYSPPAYALLSPMTYLPWSTRLWVYNWLNAVLLVVSLVLICKIAGAPIRSLAGFAIIGIGLASYPGQFNIEYGQTAIFVFFLMSLSWCIAPGGGQTVSRRRLFFSALAMGVAAIIKPQIVLVFLAFDFFSGRRTVAVCAVAAAAALFFLSLAIHGDGVHITLAWINNMRELMDVDANPLTRSPNHVPHMLINLQSPIAVLTGNRTAGTIIAFLTCMLLAAWYAWIAKQNHLSEADLPDAWLNGLSAASVLMLLVFYHRAYDAVFLLVPVAFAIGRIAVRDMRGWALLALLALPSIPSYSYVFRLLYPAATPANLHTFAPSPMVEALLIQHQTWLLVATFILLCGIRRRPGVAGHYNGLAAAA